jgi:hypothetical protein
MFPCKGRTMRPVCLLVVSFIAIAEGCANARKSANDARPNCATCFLVTNAISYRAERMIGEGALVHRRYHFPIISTFTNRSANTVYLPRCNHDSRQPLFTVVGMDSATAFDLKTGPAYATDWACAGVKPFALGPGESRVDTLEITGPNSWSLPTGEAHGVLEGTFRLYFPARRGSDVRSGFLPFAQLTSNPFTVRIAK